MWHTGPSTRGTRPLLRDYSHLRVLVTTVFAFITAALTLSLSRSFKERGFCPLGTCHYLFNDPALRKHRIQLDIFLFDILFLLSPSRSLP